jgi:hypothetical protein
VNEEESQCAGADVEGWPYARIVSSLRGSHEICYDIEQTLLIPTSQNDADGSWYFMMPFRRELDRALSLNVDEMY